MEFAILVDGLKKGTSFSLLCHREFLTHGRAPGAVLNHLRRPFGRQYEGSVKTSAGLPAAFVNLYRGALISLIVSVQPLAACQLVS